MGLINQIKKNKMRTLVIGEEAQIFYHTTKQAGYGRQHLYVNVYYDGKHYNNIYVMDVFPNVLEHFGNQAILMQWAFPNDEDQTVFTDHNGNGEYTIEQCFNTTDDLLNYVLKGHEVEIDEDDEEE